MDAANTPSFIQDAAGELYLLIAQKESPAYKLVANPATTAAAVASPLSATGCVPASPRQG